MIINKVSLHNFHLYLISEFVHYNLKMELLQSNREYRIKVHYLSFALGNLCSVAIQTPGDILSAEIIKYLWNLVYFMLHYHGIDCGRVSPDTIRISDLIEFYIQIVVGCNLLQMCLCTYLKRTYDRLVNRHGIMLVHSFVLLKQHSILQNWFLVHKYLHTSWKWK